MFRPKSRFKITQLNRKEIDAYLKSEVFDVSQFQEHIKETSFILNIEESIVSNTVKRYIKKISYMMHSVRSIRTKINIIGFFSFWVEKGR
jgi:hypothetical protein